MSSELTQSQVKSLGQIDRASKDTQFAAIANYYGYKCPESTNIDEIVQYCLSENPAWIDKTDQKTVIWNDIITEWIRSQLLWIFDRSQYLSYSKEEKGLVDEFYTCCILNQLDLVPLDEGYDDMWFDTDVLEPLKTLKKMESCNVDCTDLQFAFVTYGINSPKCQTSEKF